MGEERQKLRTKFGEPLNCCNSYPQLPSSALALRNEAEDLSHLPPSTEQLRFPRPPLAPMTSKGSPKKKARNRLLFPQLVHTPSQAKARNRIWEQKAGQAFHMRKTSSPGTRQTLHSSHRHWAPPYWTTTRTPLLANHHRAEVSAVLPDSK